MRVVRYTEGLKHVVKECPVAYMLPREHVVNVIAYFYVSV
jgi:hypothetical protein